MSDACRRSAILAVLLMMPLMYSADATIANVATPAIHGDLGARSQPLMPPIGCLILAAAYAGISAVMLTGEHPEPVLLGLLAVGGLGLGTNFSSILVHLTTAATPRYAADISGVFSTVLQIVGAIGVAGFGTLYMSQLTDSTADTTSHAFGVVTAAFAVVALLAGVTAYLATHTTRRRAHAAVTTRA